MPMDSKKIDELLNKYWNCETSLEEEQELHNYFQEGNIPEQLKETADLFRYFHEHKKKALTDLAFDHQVMKNLKTATKGKMATLVYNSMRIAAGVIVLMVAVWLVRSEIRQSTPQEMVDTYNDPKLAFEDIVWALINSKEFLFNH